MNDDPIDEPAEPRAYAAVARVVDDDPLDTLLDETGAVLGIKADCTILGGPFAGALVSAILLAPLGQESPTPPQPGQTVMLMLPTGHPDGGCYCAHVVPGGKGRPMKSAVAGVDMTDATKASAYQVNAPPKGRGVINYLRGAPYVVRLKGKSDGFHADFYVDADDGTFIRLLWSPQTQSYQIKLRDSKGAYLAVGDGSVSMQSANKENGVYVSDDGVKILGQRVEVRTTADVTVEGSNILLNQGDVPPTPTTGVAYSVAGPVNVVSQTVFIGR